MVKLKVHDTLALASPHLTNTVSVDYSARILQGCKPLAGNSMTIAKSHGIVKDAPYQPLSPVNFQN